MGPLSAPPSPSAPSLPFLPPLPEEAGVWVLLVLFIVAFLLGSIPWGVIISRAFYQKDLRDEGSGNIGTTNAFRAMGKVGGCLVFVLDFSKGLLAGYLGFVAVGALSVSVGGEPGLPLAVAFLGCIWGHIFCPWLHFHGGKGIAVAVGCLFFTFGWAGALIEIAIFALTVVLSRYVSLGSVLAAVACPIIGAVLYASQPICIVILVVAALTVIWAHRSNLSRLRVGTENRIGGKR